jgi:hypothetical protein
MTFGSREEMELYVIELYKQGQTIGDSTDSTHVIYQRLMNG